MTKLYLPGTSKVVGFILGNTMHIYDKYMKHFPVDRSLHVQGYGVNCGKKFMVVKDDVIVELWRFTGWCHEVSEKFYTFYDCQFKTPDNLDVVEVVHLNKNWTRKSDRPRTRKKNH